MILRFQADSSALSTGMAKFRMRPFKLGAAKFPSRTPLLILGPCVIESEAFLRRMAAKLAGLCSRLGVNWVLKASYDKANRTSLRSFRGPGLERGCALLAELGAEHGVPVTTDVHSPREAERAAEFIDILQIPAFLCRQTDLLRAAAASGRVVNVKKGQFLAPSDTVNIAEKIEAEGNQRYFITERGTSFGYGNLVVDMRAFPWLRDLGIPVVFDATHSVQRPGGGGDRTTGDGALAPVLARAAMAAGCDGVFMETHENPARALSDGPNQVAFRVLSRTIEQLLAIRNVTP